MLFQLENGDYVDADLVTSILCRPAVEEGDYSVSKRISDRVIVRHDNGQVLMIECESFAEAKNAADRIMGHIRIAKKNAHIHDAAHELLRACEFAHNYAVTEAEKGRAFPDGLVSVLHKAIGLARKPIA